MIDKVDLGFLCKRMKALREKNEFTLDKMVERICDYEENGQKEWTTKSSLSRIESGKMQAKMVKKFAVLYCKVLGMSEKDIAQFMRGEKIAIPDTSALLYNPQLIDELNEQYNKVIIPDVVTKELENIKDKRTDTLGVKAWEILKGIGYNEKTLSFMYQGPKDIINDVKIITVAQRVVEQFGCKVDIITNDVDYSAHLKGNESISSLHIKEYMLTKQSLSNINALIELDKANLDDYSKYNFLTSEINSHLPDGNTLIISTLRKPSKFMSIEQKKKKIRWLISKGANVDMRDCSRRYFPPLTHTIQMNDKELFDFILNECGANPNTASKNPYSSEKIRMKNEGNTPLMVAAWHGRVEFVKSLCEHPKISINQQDGNGYTALIKTCIKGYGKCKDMLIKYGADTRIIDIDDMTAEDRWNEHLDNLLAQQKGNRKW